MICVKSGSTLEVLRGSQIYSRTYELKARQLMDEFRQTEYIGWNDLRESLKYAGCFERKPEVRWIRLRESQKYAG